MKWSFAEQIKKVKKGNYFYNSKKSTNDEATVDGKKEKDQCMVRTIKCEDLYDLKSKYKTALESLPQTWYNSWCEGTMKSS